MSDFNVNEFIAMGGYAKYVWSSWALTIICMTCLVINAIYKRKKVYREFRESAQHSIAREQRLARQKHARQTHS
ncbi:MAG: heme exporter protein CcmD [Arenicella sp.]